ncbi:peptide transporter (plasmid) [Borrelia turcica IST7]|uniref:Peptide transporter n=1 Tax=Borrelia turcica IST7 TaxID=1104446 RepID=A0A386PNS6_9SPIR|nr:plasmid maintenance protein [Borrelia turcica]AYE36785.1 peptide transporter [Borrelia turcica IST7]
MKNKIKSSTNRYQSNLVVLISTLNFMNLKLNKYTQNNILYFFNGNLKRNNQKTIKMKTLQNYLYKLEKKFKVTINYCKHLGKQCGSEVYYTLQYSKKECHFKINSHFKNLEREKIKKFKERVKIYEKENGSLKWECINNKNNKREEEVLLKYINKCKFKIKLPFFLLNLKIDKSLKIEHIKDIKKHERIIKLLEKEDIDLLKRAIEENGNTKGCIKEFLEKGGYLCKKTRKITKQQKKRIKLIEILDRVETELGEKNYSKEHLRKEIEEVYEMYKEKPHFIIEQDKYKDLEKIISKIKSKIPIYAKQESADDIKNNVFSILLEQLRYKVGIDILIPALKRFINSEDELKYSKVIDNTYYYELLEMIQ